MVCRHTTVLGYTIGVPLFCCKFYGVLVNTTILNANICTGGPDSSFPGNQRSALSPGCLCRADGEIRFTNVFVKNLPETITEEKLREMFGEHGEVTPPSSTPLQLYSQPLTRKTLV